MLWAGKKHTGYCYKGVFHVEQRRMDYHLHTLHSFDGRQSLDE